MCTTVPSQPNVDQVDIEGPAAPQGGNNQSTNVAACPPRVQLSSEQSTVVVGSNDVPEGRLLAQCSTRLATKAK